jgi:hypothetical protein
VRKTNLKIVWKARVGNDYLQLGSTEAEAVCSCFLVILLAILFFLFPISTGILAMTGLKTL